MGLYKLYEKSINNKTIRNYESIIEQINRYYNDISKVYKEKVDLDYQIDSCIKTGRESFEEYLGEYINSDFVEEEILELITTINLSSNMRKTIEKCYEMIDLLIRNSSLENKEELLRKDWTNKLEYLCNLPKTSYKSQYDSTYLFMIGVALSNEYKIIFNKIKPIIDKNVLDGKSYISSIKEALNTRKVVIDERKIVSSLLDIRKRILNSNNRLREVYEEMYIKNFFITETNKLRIKVKEEIEKGKDTNLVLKEVLPYAYALVKAACEYTKGLVAYDVQLMGAIAMNDGNIAQMYTGEGKTLTAIFAAYLNSLVGREVDIFTPNDYLSDRDANDNKDVYNLLGLTVGCVLVDNQSIADKKKAYKSDVVYGSSTAFAFDFLKDTNANLGNIVTRIEKPGYVIIDEADQILINNALNPYQLTGGIPLTKQDVNDNEKAKYYINLAFDIEKMLSKSKYIAKSQYEYECITGDNEEYTLKMNDQYSLLVGLSEVYLTSKGEKELFYYFMYGEALELVEKASRYFIDSDDYVLGKDYLFKEDKFILTVDGFDRACKQIDEFSKLNMAWLTDESLQVIRRYLSNALNARYIMQKGKDYQVAIDPKTGKETIFVLQDGRIMPDSKFTEGLHQAIEVKEGLDIQLGRDERLIDSPLATISNRALLSRYDKISGMTGTAAKSAFKEIYGLDTFDVPRNKEYQYKKGIISTAPLKRIDHPVVLCKSTDVKMKCIASDVMNSYLKGQPVLVVADNDIVVQSVYNAIMNFNSKLAVELLISNKTLSEEAEIISKAGEKSAITVASEMAGRGTDIKLGGRKSANREDIRNSVFLEEANQFFIKSGITKESDLFNKVLESLKLQYEKEDWYKNIVDSMVEKRIIEYTEGIYSTGGLKYIQVNPFRTSRNDNQGKGRVGRQGEPGETVMYATLEDLLKIGVGKKELEELSSLFGDDDMIDDYSADGKISDAIESAQLVNEYNDNLVIASTDTMDFAMSSIGIRILKERSDIILNDNISTHLEKSVSYMIDTLLLENTPKERQKKLTNDNYRLSKTKIDFNGLGGAFKTIFGVSVSEKEIYNRCTDVSDLKQFLHDEAYKKMVEQTKWTSDDKLTGKIKSVFLRQINQVYKDFLYSAKTVEMQKFNDSLAQNSSHNRTLSLETIYTQCYSETLKTALKNIFRPNLKDKKAELSEPEEIYTTKLPTIEELVSNKNVK